MIYTIGIFHLLHSPIITIYPFIIQNADYDIYYVNYFLLIMLSYTFLHGECPISFLCKKRMNANYMAGENIEDYVELYQVVPNKYYVNYYIQVMTCFYLSSLLYVIYFTNVRGVIYIELLLSCVYFLFTRKVFFQRIQVHFEKVQELYKISLFITIMYNLCYLGSVRNS